MLSHVGLPVVEVDDFSGVEFPGGKVTATPFLGEHADLDIRAKSTYCVELADRKVFVGADSSGIDPVLYRYMRQPRGAGRHGVPGHGVRRGAADVAVPGAADPAGIEEDERLADAVGIERGTGRAIMTELGAAEAYVYAMGEENWLVAHVMATSYNEDSYQLQAGR